MRDSSQLRYNKLQLLANVKLTSSAMIDYKENPFM